ncbi:hypothetical protein GCM10022600_15020 [Qipengyuania pelagi]
MRSSPQRIVSPSVTVQVASIGTGAGSGEQAAQASARINISRILYRGVYSGRMVSHPIRRLKRKRDVAFTLVQIANPHCIVPYDRRFKVYTQSVTH